MRSALSQNSAGNRWTPREVPESLRNRYLADGWWTNETLGEAVDSSLRAAVDSQIHIWSATRPAHFSYAEVHRDALRLAEGLRASGIPAGSPVAFQMPNWREAIVAFYGLAVGGYVLVPIVHIYGPKEVRFILEESGAVAYISADRFGHVDYIDIVDGAASNTLTGLHLHIVVPTSEDAPPPSVIAHGTRVRWNTIMNAAPVEHLEHSNPDDVCVLAYTSGTTNTPKGVMHTHRTLVSEVNHILGWITPKSPNLMGSPVTHATGMLGAVLAPMRLGEPIHLIDRWDVDRALDIMLEAGIGAGTGASIFLANVLDHPKFTPAHARNIRRVGLGGAPVPTQLGERAARFGIALVRAYGSTEHPSITGGSFDDPPAQRHGTDGRAMPGVEIRVVNKAGEDVSCGVAGEIWSRGPDLCVGYTNAALTATVFDDEGWYHTGDMGVLDDQGFFTVSDRINDMIIRGGENISAAEVEQAIIEVPEIIEVAVVAVADSRLGERAAAVVRLAPGTKTIALTVITDHLKQVGLARQKWPEQLVIVDDFPRTATGKIRKTDVRAQLRSETDPPS